MDFTELLKKIYDGGTITTDRTDYANSTSGSYTTSAQALDSLRQAQQQYKSHLEDLEKYRGQMIQWNINSASGQSQYSGPWNTSTSSTGYSYGGVGPYTEMLATMNQLMQLLNVHTHEDAPHAVESLISAVQFLSAMVGALLAEHSRKD